MLKREKQLLLLQHFPKSAARLIFFFSKDKRDREHAWVTKDDSKQCCEMCIISFGTKKQKQLNLTTRARFQRSSGFIQSSKTSMTSSRSSSHNSSTGRRLKFTSNISSSPLLPSSNLSRQNSLLF